MVYFTFYVFYVKVAIQQPGCTLSVDDFTAH